VDGLGRLRCDRHINLDFAVGNEYATPPPLGTVNDPTVIRRNIQIMQDDRVLLDPGNGRMTHALHAHTMSQPTVPYASQLVGSPILVEPWKLRQMGMRYNLTHLRYDSLLTMSDYTAGQLDHAASLPPRPVHVNAIR